MGGAGPDGFAVVDKEAGWTSHDVVARARKLLGTRKVGHAGTLDPPATGVLVLGVGRGTRLLRFITELPKTYEATLQLGVETTTLDAEGEVTARHDMTGVDLAALEEAAAGFVGDIEQIPPMVSAVKVGGRRLHELARAGEVVERAPRPVTIHELSVEPTDRPDVFGLRVRCSSGTYIRTLAADLGTALGGGAHLLTLRRTAVGPFDEAAARPLAQIELIDLAEGLAGRPVVVVEGELATAVRHGRAIDAAAIGASGPGPWAIQDPSGRLLAVYERYREGSVKPAVVVAPAS